MAPRPARIALLWLALASTLAAVDLSHAATTTASSGSASAATDATTTAAATTKTTKTTVTPTTATITAASGSTAGTTTETTTTATTTSKTSTTASKAVGAIVVRGNKMYNSQTGERFFIKGLTYEYAVSDQYYDKYSKAAIASNLKDLNFNALRVYNINPDESYKKFMADMAARGVYVLVAASPDSDEYFGKYRYAPIRKDLGPNSKDGSTCYPPLLLEYGKRIALNFAQYDNTLGIILANEIMQVDLTAGACVKQYAADLKTWMRQHSDKMRVIPLAYAAADSSYDSNGVTVQADDYHVVKLQGLLCGDKMKDGMMQKSIDIYLINEYRWCVDSDYDATYKRFYQMAEGVPIVLGLGEFGCVQPAAKVRTWAMTEYLFQSPAKTDDFSNVFSGGLAYSYGQAKLDATARFPMFTGGSLNPLDTPSNTPTEDYTMLKEQYAKFIPSDEKAGWSSSDKCSWEPTITQKISTTNKRATASGWIIDDCDSDVLKLANSDTWITKTREGAVCDDDGGTCTVKVTSTGATTQEEICGKVDPATNSRSDDGSKTNQTGGADCTTANDCGSHGQCVALNGTTQCQCNSCYTGADCSKRDVRSCSELSSSKSAPAIVLGVLGVFLATSLAIFIGLACMAQKKKLAHDKLANQVKLGATVQEGTSI